ncbi:hypothetical protein [Nitrosomonas sp. PY1]|uniref:hypothetical protein n=1 Tax=Nitrosomonas sp. PY1 TaxID=1803906 RepID=UPI001FC8779F|nr:hypothetical protein [Nitrosomonas sp. PY1]
MLRKQIEILMHERQSLLDATGAAAVFIASLDSARLPKSAHQAAKLLARLLNSLPEETLRDALEKVNTKLVHR